MIIKFGTDRNDAYGNWADDPRVFISRPFFKIIFNNGLGFYILNSFRFNYLPKFYGTFNKTFWEFGFRFAGLTFEVMWNKFFKK
jgi:hypothetical protein